MPLSLLENAKENESIQKVLWFPDLFTIIHRAIPSDYEQHSVRRDSYSCGACIFLEHRQVVMLCCLLSSWLHEIYVGAV